MRRCCCRDSALQRCLHLFYFSIIKTQAATRPDSLATGEGGGRSMGVTVRPERSTPGPWALPGENSSWVSLAGPDREKGPGAGPVGVLPALPSRPLPPLGGNRPGEAFHLRSALTSTTEPGLGPGAASQSPAACLECFLPKKGSNGCAAHLDHAAPPTRTRH